ncbi:spore coat protein [Streptomyces sp. KAI-26]|uniref:PseG/SpsG family protein n=1 Tax=Streptomyces sp. KAI-26 TaxID=1169747 RepID=UPI0015874625|nr:spore coat protein [Streptomyces sp. KAI-26]NUV87822.1 spore coat protein [Streptomyces sp. KAI-26]NUW20246.1 spore coat protein [Streptomyces roseoviolaceus]
MNLGSDPSAAPATARRPRIGLRADASPAIGGGHVMRCLALSEELRRRGAEVFLLGRAAKPSWLRTQLADQGLPVLPGPDEPEKLVALAREMGLDAVVLDSHTLAPECAGALRAAGVVVAAVVDGTARAQEADLYVDQSPGGDHITTTFPEGARRLGGYRHALIRSAVLAARHHLGRPAIDPAAPVRVLCFFGATDPYGGVPVAVRALLATGIPLWLTAVAADPALARATEALAAQPDQRVRVIGPVENLPELARSADLIVTAAGSSVLDLLCIGCAVAVVTVTASQQPAYEAVRDDGLVAGLGGLEGLRAPGAPLDDGVAILRRLLTGAEERAELAQRGASAVDGQGSARVAQALFGLTGEPKR